MAKTLAELQADWATHGRISALASKLVAETDEAKRKKLEAQIAAERSTILPGPG